MMPDCRVLVTDDDCSIRGLVVEALELEGYNVQAAADGREAIRTIESSPPDLLLLDMRMPGLDGWQVARILKERGVELPIVVMTAAQSARRWAEEIDAADFVAKPFDLDDLIGTVERNCPRR